MIFDKQNFTLLKVEFLTHLQVPGLLDLVLLAFVLHALVPLGHLLAPLLLLLLLHCPYYLLFIIMPFLRANILQELAEILDFQNTIIFFKAFIEAHDPAWRVADHISQFSGLSSIGIAALQGLNPGPQQPCHVLNGNNASKWVNATDFSAVLLVN